jgi:ornithine decarboxylase
MPAAQTTVQRIDRYLAGHAPPTPCLLIDLATVRQHCRALSSLLPAAQIYYAVKANPDRSVIAALAGLGIGFDNDQQRP